MLTTASDVAVVEFTFILHTITTSKHTETIETSTLEITFVLVWQTPTSQAAHTTAHSTSCTSFTYNLHNTYIHIITHPKFFVNRFSVFGVMTSQNLAISNHRAGYSYNTGVLHCDIYMNLHSAKMVKKNSEVLADNESVTSADTDSTIMLDPSRRQH